MCLAGPRSWSASSGGLAFDGVSHCVTLGTSPALGLSNFTLETWFKITAPGLSTSTGNGGVTNGIPLVTKGRGESDGDNRDMNYFLGIRASDNILVADFEEGGAGASPGLNHPVAGVTPITTNAWHHAAATYDDSRWRLYLDGALETELMVGQPPRADSIQHTALASALTSTGTASGFFGGVLDEVRIWNYARSFQEITNAWQEAIVSAPGLVGRWGLDEGLGTVATNMGSSGVPGTLVSGPLWTNGYSLLYRPEVVITNPPTGLTITAPTTVFLAADATDTDGTITNVSFLDNGVALASVTNAPFAHDWTNVPVGQHRLTAVATDNSGLARTSAVVSIMVHDPVVRLTSPANGAVFIMPASVLLAAEASDTNGPVAKVEFFESANKLGGTDAMPFAFTWTGMAPGVYTLTAVATDNLSATHTSAPIVLPIVSNNPPVVAVTSPTNSAVFTYLANITIAAAASDNEDSVTNVEFFDGAISLGQQASPPYTLVWSNAPLGGHKLCAVAIDSYGFAATSAPVLVTVAADIPSTNTLVSTGSVWKYLDNGSDQGAAWKELGFNDSAWATGRAQLGYGDGDEATIVSYGPNSANKYITTYFRRSWEVADPTKHRSLVLRLLRDDGAVVYLKGREVFHSNMPPSSVSYADLAQISLGGVEQPTFVSLVVDGSTFVSSTNLLAVEIHQAAANSSDISFDFALQSTLNYQDPALVRGPYIQTGTPNSVIIRWRTDADCDSRVRFGTNQGSLDGEANDDALVTDHIVTVDGLQPDTQYFYTVGTSTNTLADGPDFYVVTPPPVGTPKPTRLWVLGDSGTANSNARNVRDSYLAYAAARPADIWLMLGDNAYNSGTDAEYQAAVFDTYPTVLRNRVLWPTIGNHETDQATTITSFPYLDIFSLPVNGEAGGMASGTERYYSFDYANIHFICLDAMTSSRSPTGVMADWLRADLASTTQEWLIAFWHHPPYTKGSHDSDVEYQLVEMRANILPILEANGVDLVLCGHSHCYERSRLLQGHYGFSSTLTDAMKADAGNGREAGTGAYQKVGGAGAVYTVAGSSGKISGGPLNHPAMFLSLNMLGSLVIDVVSNRLDLAFLGTSANVLDQFTLIKDPVLFVPPAVPANLAAVLYTTNSIRLTWPNTPTNEQGFQIERALDGTSFTLLAVRGANLTAFTDTALAPSTLYYYRLRATNTAGPSAWTEVASLSTPGPPVIVVPPQTQGVAVGANATFSVLAAGTAPFSYQWTFMGTNLPGATSDSLSFAFVQMDDAGDYAVVVSNSVGSVTSAVATLSVVTSYTVSGSVELEHFVGTTRDVAFKAADTDGVVRKTWTVSLSFSGSSVTSYALTDVPLDTVSLSAKTDWNLRRKLGVSFANTAAVANFTGAYPLPAGDLDNSNTVNLADYSALASVWYTSNTVADLDGSGFVDVNDYFLLSSHWLLEGDPE